MIRRAEYEDIINTFSTRLAEDGCRLVAFERLLLSCDCYRFLVERYEGYFKSYNSISKKLGGTFTADAWDVDQIMEIINKKKVQITEDSKCT